MIEKLYISLKRSTKQNALKEELEKLDDFNYLSSKKDNENFILGDNLFNNIKNLYSKYRNDDDCIYLIDEHVKNNIRVIIDNINHALKENNNQNLLNNIELFCTINIELNPIIGNSILKNTIDQTKYQCLVVAKQTFERLYQSLINQFQALNTEITLSHDKVKCILQNIKIHFQELNLYVKFEKRISLKNICLNQEMTSIERDNFENRFNSSKDKFKQFLEECKRNFEKEINSDVFDAMKTKTLCEFIEFISTFNLMSNGYNLIKGNNTDLKNLIVDKIKKNLDEMRIMIDDLANIGTSRHFQNYFDELFEKLNMKFNFLNDVEINLKEYYPQDDIKKVKKMLYDQTSVFFVVINTNIDLLIESYNDSEESELEKKNVNEYSNQVYNSYFAIISFKNKMKPIYLHFFPEKLNMEKTLKEKIFAKLVALREKVISDCESLKKLSNERETKKNNFNKTYNENEYRKPKQQLEQALVIVTSNKQKLEQALMLKKKLKNNLAELVEEKKANYMKEENKINYLSEMLIEKVGKIELEIEDIQYGLEKVNDDIEKYHKSIKEFEDNSLLISLIDESFELRFKQFLDSSSKVFRWIKYMSNIFLMFKKEIDAALDDLINMFIKVNGGFGFGFIGKLAIQLKNNGNALGSLIVTEHKQFECYKRSLFYRKTLSNDVKYVLADIQGSDMDKESKNSMKDYLLSAFERYESTYKRLVEEYLGPKINLKQFVSNFILKEVNPIKSDNICKINWNKKIEKKLPELIAHVFALWTLLSSDNFFNIKEKEYLFQPHPAQVISIFRMLGLGYRTGFKEVFINTSPIFGNDKDTSLRNNLVQIGTGEGKSVSLAVTSVVLALLGFDVYCVCYSEYLSDRDFQAFKSLFDVLNLTEKIKYGTFNKICENMINSNGDVRSLVHKIISNDQIEYIKNKNNIASACPRILLIDEVDVFFAKDFYGNSYNPIMKLTDPTINELIRSIWKERNYSLKFNKVKSFDEFQKCVNRFKNWQELIEEAVKDMILTLKTFSSHQYIVRDDKIGYKYHDDINFNTSYGYNTIFAYLLENEKGNISNNSLIDNLAILIRLGQYSYSEIPIQSFNSIIGVTGTLESLNEAQKKIIKETYNIKNYTITPSVYGRKNLLFDEVTDVLIESEENHYKIITQEIRKKIEGSKRVAVFVVFESMKELYKFYNSNEFEPLRNYAHKLTEEANNAERKHLINSATLLGKITLFTRSFGRGTDFIVHDENMSKNGGIHVIQEFLSEEYSEEIQIKGRTARQGESGTFQLIVSMKSLEKFSIEPNDIQNMQLSERYKFIDKKRKEYFEIQYNENIKFVDSIKEKHLISSQFLENIFSSKRDFDSIKNFLVKENESVGEHPNMKTLILLDATCSMDHLIDKTKKTIEKMFERIARVLDENYVKGKSFQIKIAVYRNYNSPEDKIYQESTWESKPQNLVKFLKSIDVEGGMGNEAIEVGFFHANRENDLSQIILIGDAAPNTVDEVTFKRNREDFYNVWNDSMLYKEPIFYMDELNILKSKGIIVHAFYVHDRAKHSFQEIAKYANGTSEALVINSNKGSEDLMNLVNVEILKNIGGEDLVKSYNRIYHL